MSVSEKNDIDESNSSRGVDLLVILLYGSSQKENPRY